MKHGKLFGMCLMLLAAIALFALLPGQAQAATEGNYEYTVYNNEAQITGVSTSVSGALTLPSTLGGYPVTTVHTNAFDDCTKLTSVTIPASVDSFSGAHKNCPNLTKYIVASGNEHYFADSNGVLFSQDKTYLIALPTGFSGSYTVPGTVTYIRGFAFYHCNKLTSVTIPAETVEIAYYAFDYCSKLTAINVNSANPAYSSDSRGVLFNKAKTVLLRAPEGISGSYTIPSGVVTIRSSAFDNCTALTSVSIPTSVTQISAYAFYNCDKLKYNTYGNGLYLGNSSNPYYLFFDVSGYDVTSCTLHANTKVVASGAGEYHSKLTSVSIPDGIAVVGEDAFTSCANLKYNSYDNGLYLGNSSKPYLVLLGPVSKEVTGCKLHSNTRIVADRAFEYCESLTSVTFNNLYDIGIYAFASTSLTSVVLPDSLTQVKEGVFSSTDLTSVTLGSKLKVIGDGAFAYSKLSTLQLPETVTTIGRDAFRSCNLTTLSIPASLTRVDTGAFASNAFTSLVLPGTLTHIGADAFYSWDLALVRFLGNAPTVLAAENGATYLFTKWKMTIQIPANNSTWTADAKAKIASSDAVWTTAKSYTVTAGANTTIYDVTTVSVSTSVSASNLIGVFVDGAQVRAYYYSVSGNTTVTLDDEYVAKLRNGTHTISLIFKDGEATAKLTVQRVYVGDLDNNSEVDVDDAIYLLQHVLMPDLFTVTGAVDYNNNGLADVDDAIYLLQHVLMPDLFPL